MVTDTNKRGWYVVLAWISFLLPIVSFFVFIFASRINLPLAYSSGYAFEDFYNRLISYLVSYSPFVAFLCGIAALIMWFLRPKGNRATMPLVLAILGVLESAGAILFIYIVLYILSKAWR